MCTSAYTHYSFLPNHSLQANFGGVKKLLNCHFKYWFPFGSFVKGCSVVGITGKKFVFC